MEVNNSENIRILKEKICSREDRILLVGIDCSSSKHDTNFSLNGKELISNYKFSQNRNGFDKLMTVIHSVKEKESANQVVLGIESTSSYWKPLASHLISAGLTVVMVSNKAVKNNRRTHKQSKQKNDRIDAKNIRNLLEQGKFHHCNIKEGKELVIEQLVKQSDHFIREKGKMITRLKGNYLAIYFPEFEEVFCLENNKSLKLLAQCSTPEKFKNSSIEKLSQLISQSMLRKKFKQHKISDIKRYFEKSIGIPCEDTTGLVLMVTQYVEDIFDKQMKIESIESVINSYVDSLDYYAQALKLKGVTKNTIAHIVAAFGDIRKFKRGKELTRMSGLDVCSSQSNQWQSQGKISKEGNSLWRRYGFLVAITGVRVNPLLREVYERKQKNSPGRGCKKRALIAVMDKYLKMIWAATVHEKFDIRLLKAN